MEAASLAAFSNSKRAILGLTLYPFLRVGRLNLTKEVVAPGGGLTGMAWCCKGRLNRTIGAMVEDGVNAFVNGVDSVFGCGFAVANARLNWTKEVWTGGSIAFVGSAASVDTLQGER